MRAVILLSLYLLSGSLIAQNYGNEWIDFNKEYYAIKVAEDGIYRITYEQLQTAGFPVTSVEPRRLQMYYRGVEMAISVNSQSLILFQPGDYLEFYGQRNDGTLDKELYLEPGLQPHNYYSLYTDTSTYFLTYHLTPLDGKRITNENPFTGASLENYTIQTLIRVNDQQYSRGDTYRDYTNLTQFDEGEGFTGTRIQEGNSLDYTISGIKQIEMSAKNPEFSLLLVGRNSMIDHQVEVLVGPSLASLSSIGTYNFAGYSTLEVKDSIDWSNIAGSGDLFVRVAVLDNGPNLSNVSVSYLRLVYPQATDMLGENSRELVLEPKSSGSTEVQIQNAPPNPVIWNISDPQNIRNIIDTDANANTVRFGFADGTQARKIRIQSEVLTVPSMSRVNLGPISTANPEYIIISHQSLMQPVGVIADAVAAYADYRSSMQGGSYGTLIVDINQLYQQFSYGETSALAIYNFMRWINQESKPRFLFLIGKGLEPGFNYYRKDPTDFTYQNLVPTAGSPGADIPFTAGLNGSGYEPGIPVGRLSVSRPEEIISYLDKVKVMESMPFDNLWRKKLLHLSGGKFLEEQQFFRAYMDGFKAIAGDQYLGGETETVSKSTTGEVEQINVADQVNSGLNMINFFGHSAPNVTDIDIGFVSDPVQGYNNIDRYPTMIINGCNAANIFIDDYLFAEDWTNTANKGAVLVLGHASFGYSNGLRNYNQLFYEKVYGDTLFMNKPIGVAIQEVGRILSERITLPDFQYAQITQIQQMTLLGDPAVSVFGTKLPDYAVQDVDIEIFDEDGGSPSSASDSLTLRIIAKNLAAYRLDSIEISVRRTLPDGSNPLIPTRTFAPIRHSDTLWFKVNNDLPNNFGPNLFEITLDPGGLLPELNTMNNTAFASVNVLLSGTRNLLPPDYSIIYDPLTQLTAQSGDILSGSRQFYFELDSTVQWGSGLISPTTITGGPIAVWSGIDLSWSDSTGYYWRTRYLNPNENETADYTLSSFSYLENGQPGWAQIEYHQWDKNELQGLTRNLGSRRLEFDNQTVSIFVKTVGENHPSQSYLDTEVIIDGVPYIYGTGFTLCANNRLNVIAFNRENGAPYAPVPGNQENPWTCGRAPQVINTYPAGVSVDDIIDAIPENEFVMIFTNGRFDFNSLSAATLARLENIGADLTALVNKAPGEPYILYGQKGSGGGNAIAEITADQSSGIPGDEQMIEYSGQVVGAASSGQMVSTQIGPTSAWYDLSVKMKTVETGDSYSFDVYGVDFSGEKSLIQSNVLADTDLRGVDANQYPYLELRMKVADEANRTPPQLDYWIVTHDEAPEGVLLFIGNDYQNQLNVTIQEGQPVNTQFGFTNLAKAAYTDSLQVQYSYFNQEQQKNVSGTLRFKAPGPLAADTSFFELPFDSKGFVGSNDLELFVNPYQVPESSYQNNLVKLRNYISVTRDATTPLLDVTFDGQYIFDGDIVSPNPEILVEIRDQNPYLTKTDTMGIEIFHYKCEECQAERVNLSSSQVVWTPATDKEPFRITYSPQELSDGIHKLQVSVEDESGNPSGDEPYAIRFEVINKSTVTNVYPYPNPFSSSVRFIFTLTGSEIPDQLMIRIMTVSGRVVREITQDEIGRLRIGVNETEYAWDGRDEFGDQLANGVYLYKVFMKIDGNNVELRPSAGDRGFKKGIGKMYLLR